MRRDGINSIIALLYYCYTISHYRQYLQYTQWVGVTQPPNCCNNNTNLSDAKSTFFWCKKYCCNNSTHFYGAKSTGCNYNTKSSGAKSTAVTIVLTCLVKNYFVWCKKYLAICNLIKRNSDQASTCSGDDDGNWIDKCLW